MTANETGSTYRDAGVDIDEGDALVERIKPHAKRTLRREVLAGIGGFGGLFELPKGYLQPVMVVGTDGVGTKLKLAFMSGRHETVGIDLVAMSVNDVVVCGAEPLVFLDYYATSGLRAAEAEKVIAGIAEGCVRAGCTLIGGETAELPGFYKEAEYDLAGFCVGVVEKERILDGSRVRAGDVVLGLASTGLHSNGYSLARKVLLEKAGLPLEGPLLEALLAPTRIYVKECLALREALETVHAFAHITGGGLPGNLPRVLPDEMRARLDETAWPRPEIFSRIATLGNVAPDEMLRTFNCGIGMCVVLAQGDVESAQALLGGRGISSWPIGTIEAAPGLAEPEVVFGPMSPSRARPLRLGVLASGSGTNLQALLDACRSGPLQGLAEVALVGCNVPGARCLERAREVDVSTILLPHKEFPSREAYDARLVAELQKHEVELVCLAGFMRLVTPVLLRAFPDRVLNIHPSLLPSFPGLHAVRQALEAGARISGCTVHFVDEGTDTGPVLIQAAVPVLDGDDEERLAQRIHAQEHQSYVRAVQLIAQGAVEWREGKKRRVQIAASAGLPRESALSLSWPPIDLPWSARDTAFSRSARVVGPANKGGAIALAGAKRVYDVIVLGPDLGGAATAALLAKRGLRVLMATLGPVGVARESSGWLLPAAHPVVPPLRQLSGGSAALDELGLGQDLQRLASPGTGALQLLSDKLRLSLPADPVRRRAELRRELPADEIAGVEAGLDALEQLGRPWDPFLVAPPPYPARGFFERRRLRKMIPVAPALPNGLTGEALAALAPFAAALVGESAPEAQARESSALLRAPLRLWGGAAQLADLCRKRAQEAGAELTHDEASHLLLERKGVVLQLGGGEVRAACIVIACEGERLAPICATSGRSERKLAAECTVPFARKIALCHYVVHADGLPLALEEAALLLGNSLGPLLISSLPARRAKGGEARGEKLLTVAQAVPFEDGESTAPALLAAVRTALEPVLPFFERHIVHQAADLYPAGLHPLLAPGPDGQPVGLRPDSDVHARALVASNAVYPGFGLEGQLVAARACANAAMELSGRKQVAAV